MLLPRWRGDAGQVTIVRPDGPTVQRDTCQCQHCMRHWVVEPGSGKQRGWCVKCNGPLCGAPKCMKECVPFIAKVYGERPW